MSPLKIALLLRIYSLPRPNIDLPGQQAFAPAMAEALAHFIRSGLVDPDTTLMDLRTGNPRRELTEKGGRLVKALCDINEPAPLPAQANGTSQSKNSLTDQELIDASKAHTAFASMEMDRSNFTEGMLLSMRAIADAAEQRAAESPTRPAPPMPRIKPMRPDYETTLRDEIASRALSWVLTAETYYPTAAKTCYEIADAMMGARK